jgi:hypothetical protein
MKFSIKKHENETWKQAGIRIAKDYGLEDEFIIFYDRAIEKGRSEEDATLDALWEWDLLSIEEESDEV